MSPYITGALIAVGAATTIEGFLLLGRIRTFLTYAKQLLSVGAGNVAEQPSKSAARDTPRPVPTPRLDDAPTGPIAVPTVPAAVVIDDEWRKQFRFEERT